MLIDQLRYRLLVLVLAAPSAVNAQGFAALASPPRFELTVKPGQTTRQVIEISNQSNQPETYRVYTADWELQANNAVVFSEALQADSCRPWVAIERREVTVAAKGRYRYRFEVTPPAEINAYECRFAIMIEGTNTQQASANGIQFPIAGRLGVIVYATTEAAKPLLQVVATRVEKIDTQWLPVIAIQNTGTAHTRLSGYLSGSDASGKKIDFTPSNLPILPGETRSVVLTPDSPTALTIQYPITIRGKLEWEETTLAIDYRFTR